MAIIVKRDEQKIANITVKELSYNLRFTADGTNKHVEIFEIINDNLSDSCQAHSKALYPEEMFAIYEYMKGKIEND